MTQRISLSHALRGRVSRNIFLGIDESGSMGHALRGRVSRNHVSYKINTAGQVTPCVGV